MKLLLLIVFLFQDGDAILMRQFQFLSRKDPKPKLISEWNGNCSKALQISACDSCASAVEVKCINGYAFYSCQKVTISCGDNNPEPESDIKCRNDNPGNSCDH